jgi:carotenoid biosynthesis protein
MRSAPIAASRTDQGLSIVLWCGVACILVTGIAFSWNPTPLAQALAALFIVCALAHAALYYRASSALALFVVCLAITFAMENIGSLTGFPFGRYHFEVDAGLPHIGIIPLIVGPLWFGGGYFSWVVACVLLDEADRRLDRVFDLLALPTVAAFVMTQWDLVMDPPNSTHCEGVDLARWRGDVRRAAIQFSRLVPDVVAVVSGLCALSAQPATGAAQLRNVASKASGHRHSFLSQLGANPSGALDDRAKRRGRGCRGPRLAHRRYPREHSRRHAVHDAVYGDAGGDPALRQPAGRRKRRLTSRRLLLQGPSASSR